MAMIKVKALCSLKYDRTWYMPGSILEIEEDVVNELLKLTPARIEVQEVKDGVTKEPKTKDGVTKEPKTKDGVTKEPKTKDGVTKEPKTKDGVTKEPKTKDGVTKTFKAKRK